MELGYLPLIPLSIFLNSSLYWIQKHYLVKWFCRKFLSDSVQLECDLKIKNDSSSNGAVANGVLKESEKHHSSSGKVNYYQGKKLVSDGEINGIAMENVGSLIAGITALVSAIVIIQTFHDTKNARSPFLIPWCHIAAWYFVVDLFNMYDTYRAKNAVSHLPAHQRYFAYVKEKWPYVVHHVVLFVFGYSFVVNDSLRGYKGDFYVAIIIGEDFSNPLVNTAKVLKMLGQDKTKIYLYNGFLLVFVFFVVRIINIPFALLVYAAQYHGWNIISAFRKLRLVCYVAITLQYALQIYWFVKIVKLALRSLRKIMASSDTQENVAKKRME